MIVIVLLKQQHSDDGEIVEEQEHQQDDIHHGLGRGGDGAQHNIQVSDPTQKSKQPQYS